MKMLRKLATQNDSKSGSDSCFYIFYETVTQFVRDRKKIIMKEYRGELHLIWESSIHALNVN